MCQGVLNTHALTPIPFMVEFYLCPRARWSCSRRMCRCSLRCLMLSGSTCTSCSSLLRASCTHHMSPSQLHTAVHDKSHPVPLTLSVSSLLRASCTHQRSPSQPPTFSWLAVHERSHPVTLILSFSSLLFASCTCQTSDSQPRTVPAAATPCQLCTSEGELHVSEVTQSTSH